MIEQVGFHVEKLGSAKLDVSQVNNIQNEAFNVEKIGNGIANTQDVNHFNTEMKEVNRISQTNGVDHANRNVSIESNQIQAHATNNDYWGNKVLEGLERLRSQSLGQFEKIELALSKPNASTKDLMEVQMMMQKWGVEQDLYAKCAGGFDRSVDTLLKAQ